MADGRHIESRFFGHIPAADFIEILHEEAE